MLPRGCEGCDRLQEQCGGEPDARPTAQEQLCWGASHRPACRCRKTSSARPGQSLISASGRGSRRRSRGSSSRPQPSVLDSRPHDSPQRRRGAHRSTPHRTISSQPVATLRRSPRSNHGISCPLAQKLFLRRRMYALLLSIAPPVSLHPFVPTPLSPPNAPQLSRPSSTECSSTILSPPSRDGINAGA